MTAANRWVLAFLVAVLALGSFATVARPARAASDSLTLYGSQLGGWGLTSSSETIPGPKLTVAQGDSVTITLHSSDGLTHEFFIDYNGDLAPSANEPTSSPFNTTASVPFTANTAGTFTYYCYFHESSMKGTFVVTSSGSTTPSSSGSAVGTTVEVVGIVTVVVVAVGAATFAMRRRARQP